MTTHLCDTCTLHNAGCFHEKDVEVLSCPDHNPVADTKGTPMRTEPDVRELISDKSMCKTCARPNVDCPVFSPGNIVNMCSQYRHDPAATKTPEPNRELNEEHLRRTVELQAARIRDLEARVKDLDQKLHGRPGKL